MERLREHILTQARPKTVGGTEMDGGLLLQWASFFTDALNQGKTICRASHLKQSCHARRSAGIRMTLITPERLFWHCGAHTATPEIGPRTFDSADFVLPKSAVFCGTWLGGAAAAPSACAMRQLSV